MVDWRSVCGGADQVLVICPINSLIAGHQLRERIAVASFSSVDGSAPIPIRPAIHELAKDVHERGLKRLAAERGKTGTRG